MDIDKIIKLLKTNTQPDVSIALSILQKIKYPLEDELKLILFTQVGAGYLEEYMEDLDETDDEYIINDSPTNNLRYWHPKWKS